MFCDDEAQELPWDYFLTFYERDLLRLGIEDLISKYPTIGRKQLETDALLMMRSSQDYGF